MDKRQTKTRRAIYQAMVELMKKEPYEKIFVKDIIDAAEIGRSTFYAHFETKEDLAQSMCFDLFDHVFADHVNVCQTHDYSQKPATLEFKIAHIFYHFRDKRQYYMGIITHDDGKLFTKFFKEYLEQRLVISLVNKETISVPLDFFKNHLAFTLIGAMQWWIKDKMQISPEEIAKDVAMVINPADIEFKLLPPTK
ncbi:MAG: TetR/AcrR family transcriptional regulator [Phascolarctobacterium sp.]|nr:TetR/AcrR family transcriptional regulator [Phascolarctobacterium sp.]